MNSTTSSSFTERQIKSSRYEAKESYEKRIQASAENTVRIPIMREERGFNKPKPPQGR